MNEIKMSNVLIYESIWNITENLTDEQTGKLFKGINQWRIGKKVSFEDPLLIGVWLGIEPNLNSLFQNYLNKVKANKANGKKGGRPKTEDNPNNPSGFYETHVNPKNLKDKEKDKEKDKDKEKEKEIDIEKDKEMDIFEFDMFSSESQKLADNFIKNKYGKL